MTGDVTLPLTDVILLTFQHISIYFSNEIKWGFSNRGSGRSLVFMVKKLYRLRRVVITVAICTI